VLILIGGARSQQADLEVLMLFGTLGRSLCMLMVMFYVTSLFSQSHRAGVNEATRPDDVVEVTVYLEVSRKNGNVICRVPPFPVSPGWCNSGTST
jgi:hypothetical protein